MSTPMAETQSVPSLRELSERASPGPWFAEAEKSDGSYGSGEDTSEGYDTAVIMTEAETRYGKPGVLFESHNSTVGSISEEHDDEWFRAWDAVSEANAAFIVALVNAFRAGRLIDPTTLTEAVAAARADGWQPIETAPRGRDADGRPRLVLLIGRYPIGTGLTWTAVGNGWWDDAAKAWQRWTHSFPPTHWMPYPAPPTPAQIDAAPGGRADG